MSKFMNVVRSKVKEGKKDECMKKLKEFFNLIYYFKIIPGIPLGFA